MRDIFFADLRFHLSRLVLMYIVPTLLLLYMGPGDSGALGFILFTFVAMLQPLVLLLREERMGGLLLMTTLPMTRRDYMLRRLTTLWVWFALTYVWVQLASLAGAAIHGHGVQMIFSMRLAAWSVFLFGSFNGVLLPLAYRFGAMAMMSLANGVAFGMGLAVFYIARSRSANPFDAIADMVANLTSSFGPVGLTMLLYLAGLGAFAAGGWICLRIFERKDL